MQYFHGLPVASLRTEFPEVTQTSEAIDWEVQRDGFEVFYQESYVDSEEYRGLRLARERDAIITEFMALHVYSQNYGESPAAVAEKIAPVVRS